MKQIRKVYHVEFVSPTEIGMENQNISTSPAAIYDTFSPLLWNTYGYLKSKFHLEIEPYSNDKCTIRLGAFPCCVGKTE